MCRMQVQVFWQKTRAPCWHPFGALLPGCSCGRQCRHRACCGDGVAGGQPGKRTKEDCKKWQEMTRIDIWDETNMKWTPSTGREWQKGQMQNLQCWMGCNSYVKHLYVLWWEKILPFFIGQETDMQFWQDKCVLIISWLVISLVGLVYSKFISSLVTTACRCCSLHSPISCLFSTTTAFNLGLAKKSKSGVVFVWQDKEVHNKLV